MGSLYRNRHELIFVFKNGTSQHRNNVQLGKYGRNHGVTFVSITQSFNSLSNKEARALEAKLAED